MGGILLADNTFGFGRVHETDVDDEEAPSLAALRTFSEDSLKAVGFARRSFRLRRGSPWA